VQQATNESVLKDFFYFFAKVLAVDRFVESFARPLGLALTSSFIGSVDENLLIGKRLEKQNKNGLKW